MLFRMKTTQAYQDYMTDALAAAKAAGEAEDVPVGAVVVAADGTVLAVAGNRVERDCDPTAHAQARIRRLYIGAGDEKSGGVFHGAKVFDHPQCHHKPEIYDGIKAEASRQMLKSFFARRR
jgi:tRNA(adenine34) deaminase